uniref:Myc-associated zinc finger protein n=1 Tax=Hucho hucho TaxID=62062 RepID=A0A4W5RQ11_9TELE
MCFYMAVFVLSFQQANEALHHQHQVAQNSLLPLLQSGGPEPVDQKPVMPILLDQKPPVSVAELLKDNVASGTGGGGVGGGGGGGPIVVVKKEPKSKTPFICGYCNKAFRDSYHLRRHESCHTGVKMVSRPKKTQTAPTMVPMISTVPQRENSGGQPSYISTIAGILTTATTSASTGSSIMSPTMVQHQHQQQHHHHQQQSQPKKPAKPVKKNHGCEMCGKAFRDVYHLNRHKLSHSDEKPFECPICQQRFKRKDRMTYHVRSHDGGVHKPYICSVCGKGFSRDIGTGQGDCCRGQTAPEEMGLQCHSCSSQGQWPDHLSCHVKHVHSSERPFKCQVTACTSAFATKDRLRSHMIRHEGKVTCNICGKMLSAAYITSHLKTHGQASFNNPCNKGLSDWQWNHHSGLRKGELTVGEILNNSFQVLMDISRFQDSNNVHNSGSVTPVTNSAAITSAMNRGNASNPVTIAAQMNITTSTVNITSPINLQHPVTITGPMNIAHPVAITSGMPMNITGPLNIAMRPMDSMPFLSQVLPSSPPW